MSCKRVHICKKVILFVKKFNISLITGAEGDITVLTDPATGKIYLRTACGELQELVADGSVFTDPVTGKNYIRTKSGRLHGKSGNMCQTKIVVSMLRIFQSFLTIVKSLWIRKPANCSCEPKAEIFWVSLIALK